MADNVPITAGTGTNIATDDVGGVHYQRFKLHTAEDASAEPIGDDDKGASRALWVAPRPFTYDQAQNSAGLTNAAYAAGEVLGTGWTFTSMARTNGERGVITGVTVLDKNDLITAVQLWFASGSITFGSDNAAPSISDADAAKLLPGSGLTIPLTDLGGCKFGAVDSLATPYVCDATSLFVYATTPIALGSGWATATDLVIRLFATLD